MKAKGVLQLIRNIWPVSVHPELPGTWDRPQPDLHKGQALAGLPGRAAQRVEGAFFLGKSSLAAACQIYMCCETCTAWCLCTEPVQSRAASWSARAGAYGMYFIARRYRPSQGQAERHIKAAVQGLYKRPVLHALRGRSCAGLDDGVADQLPARAGAPARALCQPGRAVLVRKTLNSNTHAAPPPDPLRRSCSCCCAHLL